MGSRAGDGIPGDDVWRQHPQSLAQPLALLESHRSPQDLVLENLSTQRTQPWP